VAGHAYPDGFEHHYWNPAEFAQWRKLPAGAKVFVGSMADVFGHWVPEEQVLQTLKETAKHPAVTFQFLTKNPRRARLFTDFIGRNCWIGASTPPDFMWNNPLSASQKSRMLLTTLQQLGDLKAHGVTTWISAEPLSWDIEPALRSEEGWLADPYQCPVFDWIVIGAASNGAKYYPPNEAHVRGVVGYCEAWDIPVFFKGNLKSLAWAAENWREEFPAAREAV
jgi:protein gp37